MATTTRGIGPEYHHIKGQDNVVADALSRLDAEFDDDVEHGSDAHGKQCAMAMTQLVRDENEIIDDTQNAWRTISLRQSKLRKNDSLSFRRYYNASRVKIRS